MIRHSRLGRNEIRLWLITLASAIGLIFSNNALADDYPNTSNFGIDADQNAAWYRQCIEVKDANPPKTDLPSALAAAEAENCDPQNLYYDTKSDHLENPQQANWTKVVTCAHAQDETFILMMLYANGYGVERNLRLAIKYACMTEGALAEVEGRVEHLAALLQNHSTSDNRKPFDICDDITSGFMQGFCAGISKRQVERTRKQRLAAIETSLKTEEKAAFDQLRMASEDFATARGDLETDMSGTARAALAIEASAEESDHFLHDLEQFETGNTPQYTKDELDGFDAELNKVYRQIMKTPSDNDDQRIGYTTITKDNVKSAEKIWLKFRDAWVNFANIRYPSVPSYSWLAYFTKRRAEQLKELQGYYD